MFYMCNRLNLRTTDNFCFKSIYNFILKTFQNEEGFVKGLSRKNKLGICENQFENVKQEKLNDGDSFEFS